MDMQPRFACDAMLGGLARWLRAAGYEAWWASHIADNVLVRQATEEGRTLLSSDHAIFRFAVVRDGVLPALWIPHHLNIHEQLAFVLKELQLDLREPRCMACGGVLAEKSKDAVALRIPPRTLAWLDRYWECTSCGRLFWQGTHWQRIQNRLRDITAGSRLE
jgi:uncharacterized protein with PIN domain